MYMWKDDSKAILKEMFPTPFCESEIIIWQLFLQDFFFSFPLILRKSNKGLSKTFFQVFSLFLTNIVIFITGKVWIPLTMEFFFCCCCSSFLGPAGKKGFTSFLEFVVSRGSEKLSVASGCQGGFRNHGTGATKCWRYLMVHFNGQRTWFQVWDKRMYKISRAQNNLKLLCI